MEYTAMVLRTQAGACVAPKCFGFGKALGLLIALLIVSVSWLDRPVAAQVPSSKELAPIREQLSQLRSEIDELRSSYKRVRPSELDKLLVDIEVFAKAVEWCIRHEEFYRPNYVSQARQVLKLGRDRVATMRQSGADWIHRPGRRVLAYRSKVDQSVQPYVVSLPNDFDRESSQRWPLHVVLHGRAGQMNEVNFMTRHEAKPTPDDQDWIQLDVFGRTNNAYRWSGETDVFEALADVQRRYRIDDKRITLRGFSMGGAGAWHLGMHYPCMWSSVGPGAGFVDFYRYQKQTEQRPRHEHLTLGIYDAVDYALNASNVPVCTYGGEKDPQLLASKMMVEAAGKFDVPIRLIVGPKMGHKFDPASRQEFMQFHIEQSKRGRSTFPGSKSIRFTTRTLKYNQCEWLTIEEMLTPYEPATVEAELNEDGDLVVSTRNIGVLQISRHRAVEVILDGQRLPLESAADGLLPGVYYERKAERWIVQNYADSRAFSDNSKLHKRHNLQGPIDDAFMRSFLCVRGTGEPWSQSHQSWSDWTLERFDREFDKWLRGKIQIVDDTKLTESMIQSHNLILFGDPGSNAVLKKIINQLDILSWDEGGFRIGGSQYSADTYGLSMIYPNPLNPRRYIVINSGHTIHERDFKASNSWLFPRLGDVAVQSYRKVGDGEFEESVEWAEIFNSQWQLD